MKKMSFKCIFNWLYAKTLDRAMSDRQPREDREMKTSLYRLVCVSYVSRTMLVTLFLLLFGGWNTQAWGATLKGRTAVGSGKGTAKVEVMHGNTSKDDNSTTGSTLVSAQMDVTGGFFGIGKTEGYCKFTATADLGYTFDAWYTNEACTTGKQTGSPYTTGKTTSGGTVTYYAKFTPNKYIVTFKANGGSVGTQSKEVTYDAKYGDLPVPTRRFYKFDGWYTTTDGGLKKTSETTVSTSQDHTLYAHWILDPEDQTLSWGEGTLFNMAKNTSQSIRVSSTSGLTEFSYESENESVISIVGESLQANAPGETYILVKQSGNDYFKEATLRTKFSVWSKETPVFKENGFEESGINELKVGDVVTVNLTNVSAGMNGDFKVSVSTANVMSVVRDGDVLTFSADHAGTTQITVSQTENSDIFGATKTYTFNVTRYEPEFSLDKNSLELEQTATLSLTNVSGHSISFVPEGIVSYDNKTGKITATGVGSTEMTISQPETNSIASKEAKYTIAVSKKTPTLSVKMAGVARTSMSVNRGSTVSVTFDKISDASVAVTPVSGAQYASYVEGVMTAGVVGTATYRATLPETDTYKSVSANFSLTVTTSNTHLPISITTQAAYNALKSGSNGNNEWSNNNGVGIGETDSWTVGDWDDKYVTFKFEGIPDKLTFDYIFVYRDNGLNKMTATPPFGSTVNGQLYFIYVDESADGSTWSAVMNDQSIDKDNWKSFAKSLKKTTRYIRFHLHADYGAWFKNIKVSELKYVEDPDPDTIDFGSDVINAGEKSKTSLINWCNIAPLTVTSNNQRFTVTPASFGNFDTYSTQSLTVKYTHTNEDGNNEGDITISNGDATYTKTIHVKATTTKRPQTITWNAQLAATGFAMNVGEQYPDETITAIATATSNEAVTYTSSDPEIIAVIDDTKLLAKSNGKVTITAHQAGDAEYQKVSDEKEFTVTLLQKQTITWNQNLYGLITTSGTIELTATATSGGPITYTSANESIIKVKGNVLTVVGEGETYITATQGGYTDDEGVEWLAVSQNNYVIVRNPASQCNGMALSQGSLTLNNNTREFALSGIPETLTFTSKHGTKSALWGTAPSYAPLIVEQFAFRNNQWDWFVVYNQVSGTDNTGSGNIGLDESATKIRFSTIESGTDYTVNNIKVTRKKFMRADVEAVDKSVESNAKWEHTITVSHSNIDLMTVTTQKGLLTLSTSTLGEGCGDFGDDAFTVSFTPSEKDVDYEDVIVITDGKAQPSTIEIPVRLHSEGLNQTISGFDVPSKVLTTDLIGPFMATASSELAVTYSVSDENIARIVDGNKVEFISFGTVDVIARQNGNDRYNAVEVSKTIEVSKAEPTFVTYPVGSPVAYLGMLSESTFSGGLVTVTLRGEENTAIEGTFTWKYPDTQITDNAGTHSYPAIFTPKEDKMYLSKETSIPIAIIVSTTQSLSMNDGTVRITVNGIDANKTDSKLNLHTLIASQTIDANRTGAVSYELIGNNKANATINGSIFSSTVCDTYTIQATKAATQYYDKVTDEFTVTVTRRPNTMTTTATYTKYVDEEVGTVATVINSDGDIHTSSSDETVAYYDIENNRIVIPNSAAKSFDTKEVTIKIWQDETERFEGIAEADAKTITLTVKKYDNAILVKGVANYVNTITTDSYDNGFVFTANNTDYENSPIIVTQTEGNEIATYYDTAENPKVVYSNSKLGTATWSVTQAESYKYKAAVNTFTVKVENAAMGQCFMYNDQNEYEVSTHITSFQGEETDKWYIPDAQNAQELYYEAKKSLLASEQFFIQYSKNGTDWTDLDQPDLSNWGSYQTYGPIDVSNIDFVYLRATAKTWATGTKNIKNIRLTRKPNLSAEGISITKTADNQTLYFGNVGAGKVNVNWSVVDGGEIHVVSDNDKFTIPQDVIPNTECNSGTTPVTILYHPTSTKEESATITIYNTNQRVEVTVTGKAGKAPQTIVWYINGEAVDTRTNPKPAVRTTDIITARTNRNHEVTFTSVSNAELMEITANGTLIPLQEGEVTVYAHGAVDEEDRANYAEVNDQLTFVVTEAAIQTIVWDQTFLGLDQNIEDIPLTAYAKWTDENGNEQRREVTYTVADESVAQEVDGKLNILTLGTTIITATAPGGEENGITFLEAIATKKIVVRDPNADCDRLIYTQSEEKAADCGWNLTHKVDRSIIFDLSEYGEPRTCNFDYTGASHKDLVGVYYFYAGTVKVEQYLSTINQWVEVETSLSSYSKGNKDGAKGTYVNSGDIQLDAHATKIQVSVYGAVGYFYVNNMQITLARYIEPDQETMELGEHSVGEVFKNEVPLEISYSNVAGPITITSSKPDLFYVAEENRMLDVECGAEGMKAVNVYYHPVSDSESDEAVLTISDGKMTKEVALHASTADLRYIFNSENTTWEQNNNWVGKDAPTSGDYVVEIQTDVVLTSNVSVYSLTIDEGATLTIGNGGTLTIGEGNSIQKETYGNLHVAKGGKVRLTTGELIVNDFVLDAELADQEHSGRSGQVHNTNQLVVNGDAYFDLALDPSGECSPGWYDFTVPFPVNAVNGVTRFDNSTHLEKTIKCETNYAIMDFSESRRVETGYGWKKYHSVMQPGQCYTITIDDVDNVYRFKKTATGSLNLSSTTLMAYSDVENENKGWNCLGNGTLEYANLSAEGIEKVHIYSHATNSYTAVPLNEFTYVVGSAYMIQTPSAGKEITYTHEGGTRTLRAPRRSSSETEFMLSLSQEGANYSDDRLYVSADEEATYYYEAGRELTKFAAPTDSKVAQVWANAYGMKLCDVEAPLVDDEAAVVLSFYAPKAGSYTFAVDRMPEDEADLYLTYNGSDIWNLTESPYTLDLSKGTTEGYGLRIQSRNAPQITTGVDEINGEKEGNRKVLIGNDIYIITKEGAIFNATGKKVK